MSHEYLKSQQLDENMNRLQEQQLYKSINAYLLVAVASIKQELSKEQLQGLQELVNEVKSLRREVAALREFDAHPYVHTMQEPTEWEYYALNEERLMQDYPVADTASWH